MHFAQTIAMATDLLAEGRAGDVVQMLEPLLSPLDETVAETLAEAESLADTEAEGQVRLHALMARVEVVHRGRPDDAVQRLSRFDDADARDALRPAPRAEVALWLGWGHAFRDATSDEEGRALSLQDEALHLFESMHDVTGRCWARIGQARAYFALDEYNLMRRALDEAATLHEVAADAQAERWLHDLRVPASRFAGRYDRARNHVDALESIGTSQSDRRTRGHAVAYRAALQYDLGEPPDTIIETAETAEALLDGLGSGSAYPRLAAYHAHVGACLRRGDGERAREVIDDALPNVEGYPSGQAHLQTLQARLALREGRIADAEQLLEDLFGQVHHLPHGLQRSHVALLRGELLALQEQYDDADAWMRRALRNARETGHRGNQLRALLVRARTALAAGDAGTARSSVDATAAYDDYLGVLPYAALYFDVAGRWAEFDGQPAEAETAYAQSLAAATRIGDTQHETTLREKLTSLRASRNTGPAPEDASDDASEEESARTESAGTESAGTESAGTEPVHSETPASPGSGEAPEHVRETATRYDARPVRRTSSERSVLESAIGPALARASLSVPLVAEVWIEHASRLVPDRWMGIFRIDPPAARGEDNQASCLFETGERPSPLPLPNVPDPSAPELSGPITVHDAEANRSAETVRWTRLSTSDTPAFYYGLETGSEETSPDVHDRLRGWLPVVELALDRALLRRHRQNAIGGANSRPGTSLPVPGLIAESPAMRSVTRHLHRIQTSHSPVLVTGESGAGLMQVAEAVHATSERSGEPQRVVRCASMQHDPLEARLFGEVHDDALQPGAFQQADGGTLILQEIDALPESAQSRLLEVLESGDVFPLGASSPTKVDVRVVATSSADLAGAVRSGSFREDLYFHLTVIPIRVPPLRERREDIPLLVRYYLDTLRPPGTPSVSITNRAMEAMLRYDWPGNVRQLRNEVERALLFVSSEPAPMFDVSLLSEPIRNQTGDSDTDGHDAASGRPYPPSPEGLDFDAVLQPDCSLSDVLAQTEKQVIQRVLRSCDGQITASADVLGLTRQGLYKKMKRLDIDASAFQPEEPASA